MQTLSSQYTFTTSFYQVTHFAFDSHVVNASHGTYYYPTASDRHDPGYFSAMPHGAQTGDFNGDGHKDLMIVIGYSPHTIDRPGYPSIPVFYLGDGKGGLTKSDAIFASGSPIGSHFYYRPIAADFNNDGVSDVILGSMGKIERQSDGTYATRYEPLGLLLSGGGKLHNASTNIQGQENGGLPPGFHFSHDLSVGDVDGDGDKDIYTGGILLLNNGSGQFTTAALPVQATTSTTFVMSSLIADFDGDGKGDLVNFAAETPQGSHSYLFLSGSSPTISQRTAVRLPEGLFGAGNTKSNHATTGDIDGDGDIDILVAQTRGTPYYDGRAIQILINDGKGGFTDQTASRIDNTRRTIQNSENDGGEGEVVLADVNRDGFLDIVDQTEPGWQSRESLGGITVFLNDGKGRFAEMPQAILPYVLGYQLAGYEKYNVGEFAYRPWPRAAVFDLDNQHGLDFFAWVQTPLTSWPQIEPNEYSTYVIRSTAVYGTAGNGAEGYAVGAPGFNAAFYLNENADARTAVASGQYSSALAHYLAVGLKEGRAGMAPGATIRGSDNAETLIATTGNETIWGNGGDDILRGGAGNDTLNGGFGTDTAVFSGQRTDYTLTRTTTELSIKAGAGNSDGTDILQSIERLQFSDSKLAFDTDGFAGQAYRLYQAAFNRTPDAGGLSYWINSLDGGFDRMAMVNFFLISQEFQQTYGSLDTTQFVNLIYQNVLHRGPDAGGLAYWTGQLAAGMSRADLLLGFSESAENKTNVIGVIENGIWY